MHFHYMFFPQFWTPTKGAQGAQFVGRNFASQKGENLLERAIRHGGDGYRWLWFFGHYSHGHSYGTYMAVMAVMAVMVNGC